MCIPIDQLDPKSRHMRAMGNIALIIGLLLWLLFHPSGQIERNWLHFVCGLLLGLSICINLFGLRLARRCGGTESGKP
jgi:hypothetical protein